MAQGVNLNDELDVEALILAEPDHSIEKRFPVPITGKVVVRDEKTIDTLRVVLTHGPLQVVGRAISALASLHIDNRAEGALKGAAASQIHARMRSRRASDMSLRQDWQRMVGEVRQVTHIVVNGL